MRETKISINSNRENFSKNLILNSSILILILINTILAYSIIDEIQFNKNSDDNLIDSTKARIQVEVLNGCGVTGIAEKLTEYLRSKKADVVNLGNYRSFEIENTIIIGRNEKIENAKKIALIVGLDEVSIIQHINRDYLLDVTIVLGKDYRRLIPLKKREN